jgi:4-hydroxybenzoyl-CoA thioesterase
MVHSTTIPKVPCATAFRRPRQIRFTDCDPAGIVFYPQYFVMFNDLVEDWVDHELGIGYRKLIIDRRVGLPTVRLEADFRAVSHMGDAVTLSLAVERLGGRSVTLNLHCQGAEGAIRMHMRQVIVTTSLVTLHAIDIPSDLRAAIACASGIAD